LEPSPLGDLSLAAATTTVMQNTSLDATLDAMIAAGAGSVVILVCHAFPDGILLPIASGGSKALAVASNMALIDQVIAAEAEAAIIRALPTSTPKEQQTVLDRWKKLLNSLPGVTVTGTFTVNEAEAFFSKFLESAATSFEFGGNPRRIAMKQFIQKVLRVRRLKPSRLELRACKIGDDKTTMEVVRKFFGADHLTAPTVSTFFMGPVPVSTMTQSSQPRRRGGVRGVARVPGPLGRDAIASGMIKAQDNHTTRGFVRETTVSVELGIGGQRGPSGLHLGAILSFDAFTLTVDETTHSQFRASAAVVSTGDGVAQDWSKVKKFVQGWIMPGASYEMGPFPFAGLWTPDIEDLPFVLPNETSYTKLIEQVP
jgi:hypothetical protein